MSGTEWFHQFLRFGLCLLRVFLVLPSDLFFPFLSDTIVPAALSESVAQVRFLLWKPLLFLQIGRWIFLSL